MDFTTMIMDYIKPELLILIPILWYLGRILKSSKKIADWKIPFILLFIAILFTVPWMLMFSGMTLMSVWFGIIQGVLIAMVQGQVYQYKQQLSIKRDTSQK